MKGSDGKDMNVLSKTLEKVKKGIECCLKNALDPCIGCPYERTENAEWKCGLNADVLFCIEQLEAQVPKWISMEERLPEKTDKYIVCTAKRSVYCTKFHKCGKGGDFRTDNIHITHWMPLPEPPKEEENDKDNDA